MEPREQKQNVSFSSRGVSLLMSVGALMDLPVPLCQLVYLTFLSTAVCSQDEEIKLQMDSHNFQHILSWQAKHDPAVPASYNLLYRHHRSQTWMSARQCSGIAQLSCELTEDFKDRSAVYHYFVQSVGGAQVLNSSVLVFQPLTQTILGPPEVSITSCPNCINVTIKLPTSHFRDKGKLLSLIDIYEELNYDITLKSLEGEHKRPRQKTTEEVFSTVIEELYPGRNYCVSVVVTASLNKYSIPSPWTCATADSQAQQGYHEIAVAGAVCFSLIIAAVLKCVHAAGFIAQKISLPQSLECIRQLAYSAWVCEPENTASVEIIPREVKSKARAGRGSASDDSDSSDSDSSALCDHDYTRREGLGRGSVPRGWLTPSTLGQYSVSSSEHSQAGDSVAAEPHESQEQQGHPGGEGDTRSEFLSPFSESQGNSECFTISLQTVQLGSLEQDGHSSAAPPAQEDEGDWHCAHDLQAKEDTGSVQDAPCSNDFFSGMIPKPRNARITSVNLHSTLQWDAPRFPEGNITYTVRSKSINIPGDSYDTLGTRLRLPECDVSSLSVYGHYVLQLRAEAGRLRSPWLTLRFKPMDDTTVGPPEVRLKSESGDLHVDFSGPFAGHGQDRWPLRHYYGSWNYRIFYWKKGSTDTDLASASWVAQVDTKHNSEILSQLEPWTVYCVRVQAVIPEWNKTGELSRELCEQTTHNGVTPVWVIVTILVGSMLVVATAVTACFVSSFYLYRLTKHVFCPSYVFPQHLKEQSPVMSAITS
ncbi:PREDICTED: interferon alpha/beta receptor 2 isoform X3 [Pseudopodoces humilis]|uniref:interferon alpha/beta receptor 2 isoform X3 n=1 Tax=Pseudopodoces humilis TaxID=181119 RepID=UPI0006B85E43|nr:PREDICTED: interferon alpha/beta receptor 2 isoform X3 [Pseudopodoces humilis]